jgi:hypothetical protein
MVKYFNTYGAGALNFMPDAPVNTRTSVDASGNVTISWQAAPADGAGAGGPTSYVVYKSTNGYGFDGGTAVGNVLSFTIPAASLGNGAYFFRVAAVNAGGESLPGTVVAARKNPGGSAPILIVNGFDRVDRFGDARQTAVITAGSPAVTFSRVRPRYNNTMDYVVQAASAVQAFGTTLGFASCENDAIRNGTINLSGYQAVIWLSGEQSSADLAFNPAEQTAVANYVSGGGKIFVSGSEVGYDLVSQGHGSSFFTSTLKSNYVSDDAAVYAATGTVDGIFAGISLNFDNGTSGTYDVDFPDVLSAPSLSVKAMNYSGSSSGAAIQWAPAGQPAKVVMMGFPFESITTSANRNAVMAAVLNFFALQSASLVPGAPDLTNGSDTGISTSDDLTRNNNTPGRTLQFTISGTVAGANVTVYADGNVIGTAVASGTSTTVTTAGTSTLGNGSHLITATQQESGKSVSSASPALSITVDATAPTMSGGVFNYLTGHNVVYSFSENVSATLSTADLTVTNTTTSSNVATGSMNLSYNAVANTATLTFPGLSGGILADGNYHSVITGAGVTDAAGNAIAGSPFADFFVLTGDADHNGSVDTSDFNRLSANFGLTGRNYSHGDFNYSGNVDSIDFNMLASKFGQTLPADPAGAALAAAGESTSLFSDKPISEQEDHPSSLLT